MIRKRIILLSIVSAMLIVTSSISFAADSDLIEKASGFINDHNNTTEEKEYQFRGYKWLSSYEDVKLNECKPGLVEGVNFETWDTEEEKSFYVTTDVAGLKANALFLFNDNWELTTGAYEILTEHSTPTDYYSDYTILRKALVSLYGEPISTQRYGLDDVDVEKPEEVISGLINNGASICDYWISDDKSAIALLCVASEGIIRPIPFYCQDIDVFSEYITNLTAVNTNGL